MAENLQFIPKVLLKLQTRDLKGIPNNSDTLLDDNKGTIISSSDSESPSSSTDLFFTPTTQLLSSSSTANYTTLYTDTSTETITNITSTSSPHQLDPTRTGITVIISIIAVVVSLLLVYYLIKKGKFIKFRFYIPIRRRRASTSSSRRALEEHDVMDEHFRQKPDGQSDDMFTVDQLDTIDEPATSKEEYYYDEVFGQSQFEDEATNNAMRQLYSDSDANPDTEILDLDFETLGIKFQDNNPNPVRKNAK